MEDRIRDFVPRGDVVKIFTCGPSIYSRPHLGNYRTFLFEDLLVRYLRYKGHRVIRAMNLTDVEDKAIYMAEREGLTLSQLTDRNEKALWDEWDRLNMDRPDEVPRASRSSASSMILIKKLLKNNIAYKDGGDIFYDPLRFEDFGRLFKLDMSKWPKNPRKFRKDTYPGTQWNMGDFILWHGCGEEDKVCWDEELGSGRPSWNVQDPAMCMNSLGTGIDIWCGGWDNMWRHHDYNIAVMEGAFGGTLANYWFHGGHLLLHGKKMSKSKGNVVYLEDLEKRGYPAEDVRFYLLYGNWRRRRNLTDEDLEKKVERLRDARRIISRIEGSNGKEGDPNVSRISGSLLRRFEEQMDNNLDLKGAFDAIHSSLKRLEDHMDNGKVSKEESRTLIDVMKRMDDVWKFLFIP